MVKKFRIIALIGIISYLLFFIIAGQPNLDKELKAIAAQEDIVGQVFSQSGCEWVRFDINGWAVSGHEQLFQDELYKMGLEAAEFFNLLDEYNISTGEYGPNRQVNVCGVNPEGATVNIIIDNDNSRQDQGIYETHTVVNMVVHEEGKSSLQSVDKVRNFFAFLNLSPHVSTTFIGAFDEVYSLKDKKEIGRKIFHSIKGTITQTLEEDGLISMAGYSNLIDDKLATSKGFINLQVALRYSSYWDKTYIWVGSPVITTEY